MSKFIKVTAKLEGTKTYSYSEYFVNIDHVVTIVDRATEVIIHLSDGRSMTVKETLGKFILLSSDSQKSE